MKILTDTDVVLDLLLDRDPHAASATLIFSQIELGRYQGFVAATTVTTIHYLAGRAKSRKLANKAIGWLLQLVDVAQVNRQVLEAALQSGFVDFEDAVIHGAALSAGADCIITRNVKDFKKATIPVYSPSEFLKAIKVKGSRE